MRGRRGVMVGMGGREGVLGAVEGGGGGGRGEVG